MAEEKKEFTPSPAESFEIDYLNARGVDATDAMIKLGFVFSQSGVEEPGKRVFFEGRASDGTKIKMVVEKGENYKTPAQLEAERVERELEK